MAAIYALGSNGSGQLGIGHKEDVSVPKPVQIERSTDQSQEIFKVRAGGNHTLLLSMTGILYCAGDMLTGACGVTSATPRPQGHFRQVQYQTYDSDTRDETGVLFCTATWEASIIVRADEDGHATRVFGFGTGMKGELGLGNFIFSTSKAALIESFPPPGTTIVDLAASVSHVVAVLSNGDVYGWGNGRKGQLGEPAEIIYSPRKISNINFRVLRAVCGREFTYLLGSSESGEHLVLAPDKSNTKTGAPEHVRGWKNVAASWGSVHILKDDGSILAWGRNDHGQLGPQDLPKLSQIAVGSEHVVAVDIAGNALAWGWGEHGNCGPTTTGGDVKGRWNVIVSSQHLPENSKIVAIGAGCATSWIQIGK